MKLDLPTKPFRKGKSVFIAHLGSAPHFSVFIASAYWAPRKSWGYRRFRKLTAALRYAKELVDALGNGQTRIDFVGSMTYHHVNLATEEID